MLLRLPTLPFTLSEVVLLPRPPNSASVFACSPSMIRGCEDGSEPQNLGVHTQGTGMTFGVRMFNVGPSERTRGRGGFTTNFPSVVRRHPQ